jgi:hypothetical protein
MAFSDVSAPLLAPDPPKDMLLRTVSAPLTPPADPAHDVDDLSYIPAATAPASALVVVPSGSQPGSPQTFPEPAPRATAAVVGSGNKHGRKLDRPHRAPRERTLSSTPGVVFHLGAPSAEPADSAFEILEFLQSRQQERATYEAAAAAAAAAALVAAAPPAWEREDAHDHQHDRGDDGVEEEEEDDDDSAFTWTDDGDDGGVQEVPYALHGRYGSSAGAAAVGLGPVRARKPPARKAASLAMPHPTPARLSVFYPKNPKSDRVPGGKQANNGNKKCFACGTKKTPYWRDGWDGVLLCNACGIRFTKYRLRCLSCLYVPRKDEKHFVDCVKCGAAMPPPAR